MTERLSRLAERLEARHQRLARAAAHALRASRHRLEGPAATLRGRDPRAVLGRGYAIVRDGGGAVLSRAETVRAARGLEIERADGRVRAPPDRSRRRGPDPEPEPEPGRLL
jgi:exodeoxyribonuclease VII large subunit